MAQLRTRDFRAMLDFIASLHAVKSLDGYVNVATRGLRTLIQADVSVYNEVNPFRRRAQFVADPSEKNFPEAPRVFAAHMHEHPMLTYWRGGSRHRSERGAVTLSDLVGRRQWRKRALYGEFYGPHRLEHIIGVRLPAPAPIELHLTLVRGIADFGERDRLILNSLRPHLVAAYEHAEALTDRARELAVLREVHEALGRAIVVLGPDLRIRQTTQRARVWLRDYFGSGRTDPAHLPAAVEDWVKAQEGRAADGLSPARRPLITERSNRRLTARLLPEGGRLFLLLTEEKLGIEPGDLVSLGLAPRETEVLAWVAKGRTNEAIAQTLGLAPSTIKHCLERIYLKLDVRSRAAATAVATRAAAGSG